jgi:hypothetical protein
MWVVADSVTRLKVRAIGDCFPLGSLLKITVIAHFLGLIFSWLGFCNHFYKNALGFILGDFSINSSGHPGGGQASSCERN